MNYNFDKLSDSYFMDLDDARHDVRVHGEQLLDADKSLYVYDFDSAILKLFKEFFKNGVRFLFMTETGFKRSQVIEIRNNNDDYKTRALIVVKTDDGKIIENKLEDLDITDLRDGSTITEITVTKERVY